MLARILNKPLICWTYSQVRKSRYLDEVVVATDSKTIAREVEKCGGKAIITSKKHRSGTERVAETAKILNGYDVIINVQGDQTLVSPKIIGVLARVLLDNKNITMATIASPIKDEKELSKPDTVKVIVDKNGYALYFSRFAIPFTRNSYTHYLKHNGIYGFRRDFLMQYARWRHTPLESAEDLEQLRVLEHGHKIKVIISALYDVEVNIKKDLERIRKVIKENP